MCDGNAYYAEECIIQYGRSPKDYVTETGEQVYSLGRLSTMDLWRLRHYVSQINVACDYHWLSEPIQIETPMGAGGGIGGTIMDEEEISAKMAGYSTCYLNLSEENELFVVLDNRIRMMAMDDYAKAACLLFLETYCYERAEELFFERYQAFLEVSPYVYN